MKEQRKIIIAMCGVHFSATEILAKKLTHYLNWIGYNTRLFTIVKLNDKDIAEIAENIILPKKIEEIIIKHSTSFLAESGVIKNNLNEICDWLEFGDGEIAIYDSTNHTFQIRELIVEIAYKKGFELLFIEIKFEDEYLQKFIISEFLKDKINNKTVTIKLESAISVFEGIQKNILKKYDPIKEKDNISFIKLNYKNDGKEIYSCGSFYHISKLAAQYLYHLNIKSGKIYLVYSNFSLGGNLLKIEKIANQFIERLVNLFSGRVFRVYSATDEFSLKIFKNIILKIVPVKIQHELEKGFHILPALDEKETTFYLSGLTYKEILTKFAANEKVQKKLKELNLNTDIMLKHEAELIFLEADKLLLDEFTQITSEKTDNELKEKLASVILELSHYSEDVIVITNKKIATEFLSYFTRENVKDIQEYGVIEILPF